MIKACERRSEDSLKREKPITREMRKALHLALEPLGYDIYDELLIRKLQGHGRAADVGAFHVCDANTPLIFEIKQDVNDLLHSGCGQNFCGALNYFVVPTYLAEETLLYVEEKYTTEYTGFGGCFIQARSSAGEVGVIAYDDNGLFVFQECRWNSKYNGTPLWRVMDENGYKSLFVGKGMMYPADYWRFVFNREISYSK